MVTVTANGGGRAEIAVGETVELLAEIEVPPNTGKVVSANWDLDGKGDFPIVGGIKRAGSGKELVRLAHALSTPDTYFPASEQLPSGTATWRPPMPAFRIWTGCESLSHHNNEPPDGCLRAIQMGRAQ